MKIIDEIKDINRKSKARFEKILAEMPVSEVEKIKDLFESLGIKPPSSIKLSESAQAQLKLNILEALSRKVVKEKYPNEFPTYMAGKISTKLELKIEMVIDQNYRSEINELLGLIKKANRTIDKLNYLSGNMGIFPAGEQILTKREQYLKDVFPEFDKAIVGKMQNLDNALKDVRRIVKNDDDLLELAEAIIKEKGIYLQYLKLKVAT